MAAIVPVASRIKYSTEFHTCSNAVYTIQAKPQAYQFCLHVFVHFSDIKGLGKKFGWKGRK